MVQWKTPAGWHGTREQHPNSSVETWRETRDNGQEAQGAVPYPGGAQAWKKDRKAGGGWSVGGFWKAFREGRGE